MNLTPLSSDIQIYIPKNERQSALKIKELMPEAEFTGLSSNVRVDESGNKWFLNNDPYTKAFSKYDAYAYEWTVGTGEDHRSSYIKNHSTENMGFEEFLGYVRENGLDKELNVYAIKDDMFGTDRSDYTTLSQQADHLAAYFAQLENHVNINFSGEEKEAQLKIIQDTVGKAIDDLSKAYADNAGGVLEDLGLSGEKEKIRQSVKKLVEDRIDSYREIIREDPDFADINGTDDEWLKGSHRFMASMLQKAYAEKNPAEKTESGYYSENDLIYIGKTALSLPSALNGVRRVADEETIGFALGTVMTKVLALGKAMGAGSGVVNTAKNAVSAFEKRYMDIIDSEMSRRREHALNSRERNGYDPLDRKAVMDISEKMRIEYENTQSLMNALLKGMKSGYEAHGKKVSSGSKENQLRYNENDCGFWRDMYRGAEGKESISSKIELDAMLYENSLAKKDLGTDMGFFSLDTGYFTFSQYTPPLSGSKVTELLGKDLGKI